MKVAFKRIDPRPPVFESDHVTAQRSARAYVEYMNHADQCPACKEKAGTFGGRCWRGQDLWISAQQTAVKRALKRE